MKKDILYVVGGTAILSTVMVIIFLIIGYFDLAVLFGALLGFVTATVNFCLLARAVTKAVEKPKNAGAYMGSSYILRLCFIGVVIVYAIKSPFFNYIAVAIPLVFPRVIIILIQGIMKWKAKSVNKEGDSLGGA